ncbi:DEAD/DEAH box helicase family protein [Eubacterium sp. 14-2]|uniref:DEAD/DEAH box helicase family protein n=1 Tax=Eubacterium sp. 14-2 TaxID=1235790 RepID=UPI0012DE717E|nr:DEAD/DEAH box helicase family protein [Eubacterium sp. 14-2]
MMKQYDFQNEAVDWLCGVSTNPASKQTIVLKAPTGSGKTVILIKYIDKYLNFEIKTY